MAGYTGKDFCKQLEEVMKKCDNLSLELKTQKKNYDEKIDKLVAENKKLKEKNEKLTNEVDRLKKQLNNDSNNSSKPPSSDIKKNIPNNREKTNKKKGGQKGHTAHFLSKRDVEAKIKNNEFEHTVIDVGNTENEYLSKYILDINISVIAKEYRFHKDEEGRYNIPKEFKTDVQYGNELKTMCSVLNTEGIVAIDRLTDFVSSISHGKISLSKGTIVNFINNLSEKSEYIIEQIKQKVLNSKLMYTDATVARCNNRNISVRNYSTKEYTLLIPTLGKGKKYIEESNILNIYTGNLVHDHETVMYNYGSKHSECNVHVSRYLKGNYENTHNPWALKMRCFLCSLNEYKKELQDKGINKISKVKLEKYSERYDKIIAEGYVENKEIKSKYLRQEEQKLLNRLKKYKENHLLFLYDFGMPFDNNLSERDLRHVKSKQKISGHFNSIEGIKSYLNIKSIIGTCKKKTINFYEIISKIYNNTPVVI